MRGLTVALCGAALLLTAGCAPDPEPGPSPAPSSPAPSSPAPSSDDGLVTWVTEVEALYGEPTGAELLASVDGTGEETWLIGTGDTWIALTGVTGADEPAAAAVHVHGLQAGSGAALWSRELDGALCADQLLGGSLFCASVVEFDTGTGEGSRWRLHLIDPETGEDRATAEIDGWVSAVHVTAGTIVLLEQPEMEESVRLRGFAPDLTEAWTLDLAGRDGVSRFFPSADDSRSSPSPVRPTRWTGPMLERISLDGFGPDGGVLAAGAGAGAALVDVTSGDLLALPACVTLADDGERLWCNRGGRHFEVSSWTYAGEREVQAEHVEMISARARPVFADRDGHLVTVDAETGEVGPAYGEPVDSAWAYTTASDRETYTLVTTAFDGSGLALLGPDADEVVWRTDDLPELSTAFPPYVHDGRIVLGGGEDLLLLSPETGEVVESHQVPAAQTLPVGDGIAGVSSYAVAALDLR
ncbi:hypothetical protein [Georgenia alba]|uniref:PQQ-binding-like beta-propeller repeat protein n=1 Tax=Georgenia alba TaxID=2233858 RepID=A0ABW2QBF0_9MICO